MKGFCEKKRTIFSLIIVLIEEEIIYERWRCCLAWYLADQNSVFAGVNTLEIAVMLIRNVCPGF
jgi:hypothetical protein